MKLFVLYTNRSIIPNVRCLIADGKLVSKKDLCKLNPELSLIIMVITIKWKKEGQRRREEVIEMSKNTGRYLKLIDKMQGRTCSLQRRG